MTRFVILLLLVAGSAHADRRGRTVIVETSIEVFGPIRFEPGSSMLRKTKSTTGMLDALAESLVGNPSITLLEIRAFGADAQYNQQYLGMQRARAIVNALVARGVAKKRLVARGMAFPRPGETSDPGAFILQRDTGASSVTSGGLLLQKH